MMKYWWVNQNQTYKYEVPGGFMWSPKTRADGGKNQYYLNMAEVEPGDIIFSFCDTRIKALGVAVGTAESAPKPDFEGAGSTWANEGWLVPVEFSELGNQVRPKDHISKLIGFLPAKYSPLQNNGNGLQNVYLASVPDDLADALVQLIGQEAKNFIQSADEQATDTDFDKEIKAIEVRSDIGATHKKQLINARRGQGRFRNNVRLHERACRVTNVSNIKHLRASHIKPWRVSSDAEKLDGSNGLLLAPHIDHLFDQGYISFENNGDLAVSSQLPHNIQAAWNIQPGMYCGAFSDKQNTFLEYHRKNIFKG